jgi:hypothetical protein
MTAPNNFSEVLPTAKEAKGRSPMPVEGAVSAHKHGSLIVSDKPGDLCEYIDCTGSTKPQHGMALSNTENCDMLDIGAREKRGMSISWEEAGPLFRGDSWQGEERAAACLWSPKIYQMITSAAKANRNEFYSEDEFISEIVEWTLNAMVNNKKIKQGNCGLTPPENKQRVKSWLKKFLNWRAKDIKEEARKKRAQHTVLDDDRWMGDCNALVRVCARNETRELIMTIRNPNHRLAFLLIHLGELLEDADIYAATKLSRSPTETLDLLKKHWHPIYFVDKKSDRKVREVLTWILFCDDHRYTNATDWKYGGKGFEKKRDVLRQWNTRFKKDLIERHGKNSIHNITRHGYDNWSQ